MENDNDVLNFFSSRERRHRFRSKSDVRQFAWPKGEPFFLLPDFSSLPFPVIPRLLFPFDGRKCGRG